MLAGGASPGTPPPDPGPPGWNRRGARHGQGGGMRRSGVRGYLMSSSRSASLCCRVWRILSCSRKRSFTSWAGFTYENRRRMKTPGVGI